MTRETILKTISAVLFCLFFSIGLSLAAHKPLWNDELHTQFNSVQKQHFAQVILLGAALEGNNAPLYYVLQKWVNCVPGVKVSAEAYADEVWADPKAQLVLRVDAIVFMSLALCGIFYFFSSEFSIWAGIYALLCALASPMVWLYWAEARPYPLVFLLTVVQGAILIKLWRRTTRAEHLWGWLAGMNMLLVLTSYLSIIQVFAATVVLFVCGLRSLRKMAWLFLLPLVIALCYRYIGTKLGYSLDFQWRYLLDNIPLDRIVFFLTALVFLYPPLSSGSGGGKDDADKGVVGPYLGFVIIVVACMAALLAIVSLQKNPVPVSLHSRFFISLAPIGIMFQAALAWALFYRYSKNIVMLLYLSSVGILLGVIAFFNTCMFVIGELKL